MHGNETMKGQDLGPLAWVLAEMRQTYAQAMESLQGFAQRAADPAQTDLSDDTGDITKAKNLIHQTSGALEMVGAFIPAFVLRQCEQLVGVMAQRPQACTPDAVKVLTQAGQVIGEYLEILLQDPTLSPVLLFPAYRSVHALTGATPPASPADLWHLEGDLREPEMLMPRKAITPGPRVRALLDRAILHVMQGKAVEQNGRDLVKICLGLAAGNQAFRERTFWKVAAGFFEGVSQLRIPNDIYVKRAATRVLVQYTTLNKGDIHVTARWMQDLLFFCSQARDVTAASSPVLHAVRSAFGLENAMLVDYTTNVFNRLPPEQRQILVEHLKAVADGWGAIVEGQMQGAEATARQLQGTSAVLIKLFPETTPLLQTLVQILNVLAQRQARPSPELAMEVATTLLYLQAMLEDIRTRSAQLGERMKELTLRLRSVAGQGESKPLPAWMEELYTRVRDNETIGSVASELRASLTEAENHMDRFFRNHEDIEALKEAPSILLRVRGVLAVLGMTPATKAITQINLDIQELIQSHEAGQLAASEERFEKIGSNLGALSLQVDMLAYQPSLARELFVFDGESGRLQPLMGRLKVYEIGGRDIFEHVQEGEHVQAESDAPAEGTETTPGGFTPTVPHTFAQTQPATSLPPQAAPAPVSAPAPQAQEALAAPPAVAPAVSDPAAGAPQTSLEGEGIDEELLEIFLDEAREVIGNGRDALSQLASASSDVAQQTILRRAFHTLKGSSRMVGLESFGAAAWAMEQLMNGWLAEQKAFNPNIQALCEQALNALQDWVEGIATRKPVAWQVAPFQRAAEAMRNEGRLLSLEPGAADSGAAPGAVELPKAGHLDEASAIEVPALPEAVDDTPAISAEALPQAGLELPEIALDAPALEAEAEAVQAGEALEASTATTATTAEADFGDLGDFNLDDLENAAASVQAEALPEPTATLPELELADDLNLEAELGLEGGALPDLATDSLEAPALPETAYDDLDLEAELGLEGGALPDLADSLEAPALPEIASDDLDLEAELGLEGGALPDLATDSLEAPALPETASDDLDLEAELGLEGGALPDLAADSLEAPALPEIVSDDLDLEAELGLEAQAEEAAAQPAAESTPAQGTPSALGGFGLDFDNLDLDVESVTAEVSAIDAPQAAEPPAAPDASSLDLDDLDLDLDLDPDSDLNLDAELGADLASDMAGVGLSDAELTDSDLPDLEATAEEAAAVAEAAQPQAEQDFSLDDLNLDDFDFDAALDAADASKREAEAQTPQAQEPAAAAEASAAEDMADSEAARALAELEAAEAAASDAAADAAGIDSSLDFNFDEYDFDAPITIETSDEVPTDFSSVLIDTDIKPKAAAAEEPQATEDVDWDDLDFMGDLDSQSPSTKDLEATHSLLDAIDGIGQGDPLDLLDDTRDVQTQIPEVVEAAPAPPEPLMEDSSLLSGLDDLPDLNISAATPVAQPAAAPVAFDLRGKIGQDIEKIAQELEAGQDQHTQALLQALQLTQDLEKDLAGWASQIDAQPLPARMAERGQQLVATGEQLKADACFVQFLKQLAQCLTDLTLQTPAQPEPVRRAITDSLQEIQSALDGIVAGTGQGQIGRSEFDRLTTLTAQGGESAPPAAAKAAAAAESQAIMDQIDPDLFPIFEEEAIELLPRLVGGLRHWISEPPSFEARSEVLRVLHTLKGSSRLAGARQIGEMAHRFESDIEAIEAKADNAEQLPPLLARYDELQAAFDNLRRAANEVESSLAVPDMEFRSSTMMQTLEPASAPAAPATAPTAPSAPAAAPTSTMKAVAAAPAKTAAPAADAPAPAPVAAPVLKGTRSPLGQYIPELGRSYGTELPGPSPLIVQQGSRRLQTVRVRSSHINRLINQAGEIQISRSRAESRLRQLNTALDGMTVDLDRLRQQLRELEVQTESQMQSRMTLGKESVNFDPLELDRFTRVQELTRMMAETVNDVATVQRTLQAAMIGTEDDLVAQERKGRELQRDLLHTRMVEFDSVAERLHTVVRQAASDTGKLAELVIENGNIEMDRVLLDRLMGGFEHLLRNCVGHGIETPEERESAGKSATGRITLTVEQEGNDVAISFSDDGAGLNLDAIRRKGVERGLIAPGQDVSEKELSNLIFMPGFTTAQELTGVSGRGIGMDVVRVDVSSLGGRIETTTTQGQGTTFRMVMPLTTAVTQVMLVRAGSLIVGLPANLIDGIERVGHDVLMQAYESGLVEMEGKHIQFYWAGAMLQHSQRSEELEGRTYPVVLVRSAAQVVAVHVDEVLGNQEVVVKNLGPQLSTLPGLTGMSVLASGAVLLVYNFIALASVYGAAAQTMQRTGAAGAALVNAAVAEKDAEIPLVMVVDDSITVRRVTERMLKREGYRVVMAANGALALEALQQGELPVVILSDIEMPQMDGFELLTHVRADQRLAQLPVVMITSRMAQKHREHAMQLGANHYLGKPYADAELLALVRQYADAARAHA